MWKCARGAIVINPRFRLISRALCTVASPLIASAWRIDLILKCFHQQIHTITNINTKPNTARCAPLNDFALYQSLPISHSFPFCTITIDHQLHHHHHHHHGHPHPHPDHHDGHDRDVNNAINQGGTAGAWDRTNGKGKRREIRPRGTLEISHENLMEISWKKIMKYYQNILGKTKE